MTDPILYLSMLLGLMSIYTLISSFGDDDDDNGGDGTRYIYNLEFAKPSNQFIKKFYLVQDSRADIILSCLFNRYEKKINSKFFYWIFIRNTIRVFYFKININKTINELPTRRRTIKNAINLANPMNYHLLIDLGLSPNIIPKKIYANFLSIKAVSGSSLTLIL